MYFGKYVNEKGQDTQDCCYQTCHLKIAITARGDQWPAGQDPGNGRPFPTSGAWAGDRCRVGPADTSLSPLPQLLLEPRSEVQWVEDRPGRHHWHSSGHDLPLQFPMLLSTGVSHTNVQRSIGSIFYHTCKIYIPLLFVFCQTWNLDMLSMYWNYSVNQPGSALP